MRFIFTKYRTTSGPIRLEQQEKLRHLTLFSLRYCQGPTRPAAATTTPTLPHTLCFCFWQNCGKVTACGKYSFVCPDASDTRFNKSSSFVVVVALWVFRKSFANSARPQLARPASYVRGNLINCFSTLLLFWQKYKEMRLFYLLLPIGGIPASFFFFLLVFFIYFYVFII